MVVTVVESVKVVVVLVNQTVQLAQAVVEIVLTLVETVVVATEHVQVVVALVHLAPPVQGVRGVKAVAIRVLQGAPQTVRQVVRITVVQAVHLRLDRVLSEHK